MSEEIISDDIINKLSDLIDKNENLSDFKIKESNNYDKSKNIDIDYQNNTSQNYDINKNRKNNFPSIPYFNRYPSKLENKKNEISLNLNDYIYNNKSDKDEIDKNTCKMFDTSNINCLIESKNENNDKHIDINKNKGKIINNYDVKMLIKLIKTSEVDIKNLEKSLNENLEKQYIINNEKLKKNLIDEYNGLIEDLKYKNKDINFHYDQIKQENEKLKKIVAKFYNEINIIKKNEFEKEKLKKSIGCQIEILADLFSERKNKNCNNTVGRTDNLYVLETFGKQTDRDEKNNQEENFRTISSKLRFNSFNPNINEEYDNEYNLNNDKNLNLKKLNKNTGTIGNSNTSFSNRNNKILNLDHIGSNCQNNLTEEKPFSKIILSEKDSIIINNLIKESQLEKAYSLWKQNSFLPFNPNIFSLNRSYDLISFFIKLKDSEVISLQKIYENYDQLLKETRLKENEILELMTEKTLIKNENLKLIDELSKHKEYITDFSKEKSEIENTLKENYYLKYKLDASRIIKNENFNKNEIKKTISVKNNNNNISSISEKRKLSNNEVESYDFNLQNNENPNIYVKHMNKNKTNKSALLNEIFLLMNNNANIKNNKKEHKNVGYNTVKDCKFIMKNNYNRIEEPSYINVEDKSLDAKSVKNDNFSNEYECEEEESDYYEDNESDS